MPLGICHLCKHEADLQLSHVVPAFVYRWLRKTSGNGYFRRSTSPNLRVQDGPQRHWLCSICEERLGRSERSFATDLFLPYVTAPGDRYRYGPWLLKFCVSVSWRNILLHREHPDDPSFTTRERGQIKQAEELWRKYLLGEVPHPGQFRQFILPLDRLDSAPSAAPSNINRYLMRAIDLDVCHGGTTLFTYSKLPRFAIFGFISDHNMNRWVGGKVNANYGFIQTTEYVLPAPFEAYLLARPEKMAKSLQSISDKQHATIEQSFRANVDRLAQSDAFAAMRADVEMFGTDAFTNHRDESNER